MTKGKEQMRKALASLSFAEKIKILKKHPTEALKRYRTNSRAKTSQYRSK
jgi:hypothetical protein